MKNNNRGASVTVTPADWVQGWLFEAMTGYTLDAQDSKRKRGIWEEGVIWKKAPDGRILYNWRAYTAWVEQECPSRDPAVSAEPADRH